MDDVVLVCERCGREYEYHEAQEECQHVWKPAKRARETRD